MDKGVIHHMMRNDLCWCGSGKKYKKCHEDFDERIAEMKFDVSGAASGQNLHLNV